MKIKLMLIMGLMLAAVGCSSVMPEKTPEPEVQQVTVVENPSSKEVTTVPAKTTNEVMPSTQMEMPSTEIMEKAKDKVPVKKIM
ncbi:MAG: hypothetical protein ACRCTS_07960 [Fusobacteriaceae bacterium]